MRLRTNISYDIGGCSVVILSTGQICLVDTEDFPKIEGYYWYGRGKKKIYAITNSYESGQPRMIFMHRLIMNPREDEVVDHISSASLDNRKSNLRRCLPIENAMNLRISPAHGSGLMGVSQDDTHIGFWAVLTHQGRHYKVGPYATDVEAAIARDQIAKYFRGRFAALNFQEEFIEAKSPEEVQKSRPRLVLAANPHPRGVNRFRGVSELGGGRFRAYIQDGKKQVNLGHYLSAEEAALAYDSAAKFFHKQKILLNFPDVDTKPIPPSSIVDKANRDIRSVICRSEYKGVSKAHGRWIAEIRYKGKVMGLGMFDTAEDAARAYDRAARYESKYAFVNFPEDVTPCNPEIIQGKARKAGTLGYYGVTPKRGKFWARLHGADRRSIGYFDTPEQAAMAHDEAARKIFGDSYRRLNFPVGEGHHVN